MVMPKSTAGFSASTRSGLSVSLSLHAVFLVALFLIPWLLSLRQPPQELFFELVSLPPDGEVMPQQPVESAPEPDSQPIRIAELESLESLPEINLERLMAPEPEPEPAPRPEPRTEPARTPPPEPAPPQRVSYDQWRQGRNLPERTTRTEPAPRRSPQPVPQVETRVRERLESALSEIRYDRRDLSANVSTDEMAAYISGLSRRLQSAFEPVGSRLEAEVEFQVQSNGRFANIRIIRGSGSREFDEAVRRTFSRTQPPGPPPGGRAYTFTLTFRSIDASG